MSTPAQSYANHRAVPPPLFLAAAAVLAVNAVWHGVLAVQAPGFASILALLVALSLFAVLLIARRSAQIVQDRVIRLEMRLRMRELLPADLIPRIPEFTAAQLVALRFASDRELPALARQVLEQRMNKRKAIKQLVKEWQADHLRA
jgi:hypothetical protein